MKRLLLFIFLLSISTLTSFSQTFEKQGAGVTILVHGWNPDGSQPAWMQSMADKIIARNGGVGHIATITVTGTEGNLSTSLSNWTFSLATQNHAEIIVLVNWTAVSNHLTTGIAAQEVAAAVAPLIYNGQNGEIPLASLPIHLIGHSRGGGMIFEIARLLGLQGVEVEHVTALDPHPLTAADPQGANPPLGPGPTIDASINVYENILFADCYYQNISAPTGQYINGAYNRLWTSLPGGYHNESGYTYSIGGTDFDFSDHLNIILMYHGTIDLATPTSNGEATMTQTERDAWFNTYENAGENTGYKYSRQIMGNRKSSDVPNSGDAIIAGFHNNALLGGTGARTAIDWTNAVYPNVLTVDASLNGNALNYAETNIFYLNDLVQLNTTNRTNQNDATIIAYLDTDRNPYNSTMTYISDVSVAATGSTITQQSLSFDLSGDLVISAKYYLLVEITDEGEQRFLYAPYQLEYGGSIDASVTGITKPVKNFGNTVVKANVYNNGDVQITEDFPISYSFNGNTVTETFTATIDPDATVEYTFIQTADLSEENIHTLTVFTDLQHDNDATNDTLLTQINTYINSNVLAFDGTNDHVEIAEEPTFDFDATPFTVEAWFKITVNQQSNIISKHHNDGTNRSGYCIEYDGIGHVKSIIGYGGGWAVIEANVNLNQAYHVVMTYNSDTIKMYLDGQLIGTLIRTMLYNNSNTWIGGSQTYGNYFGGNIDEVRFWNSERTQQQIQDNMNTEIDPTSANLVAYYNFNRGISGGDNTLIDAVADMTVNNFHGTLQSFNLTNGNNTSNFIADCGMDFEAPETPTLADLTGECSVTATAPTTTDNCAGTVTGTTTDPTEYTEQGTYTITWTFEDNNGHSTTAQQTVIVEDNINPIITCVENQTVTADNTHHYTISGTEFDPISTNDNCGVANVINNINSASTLASAILPEGTTNITWTVTDNAGNTATCSFDVIVDIATGISDLSANGISIYPNPTSDKLTIDNEQLTIKNIEITDITGKTIQSFSNFQINQFSNYEIDLSDFESGIYLMKISTDKEVFTTKLIKK